MGGGGCRSRIIVKMTIHYRPDAAYSSAHVCRVHYYSSADCAAQRSGSASGALSAYAYEEAFWSTTWRVDCATISPASAQFLVQIEADVHHSEQPRNTGFLVNSVGIRVDAAPSRTTRNPSEAKRTGAR